MRKFLSAMSPPVSGGNDAGTGRTNQIYWEKPWQSKVEKENSFRSPENPDPSNVPEENIGSTESRLKRSLFSCHSISVETLSKSKRRNMEKTDPPSSPCSTPIALKCRQSRVTQTADKKSTSDFSTDGGQEDDEKGNKELITSLSNGTYLAENNIVVKTERPPRADSAKSPAIQGKENRRFQSLKDVGVFRFGDWEAYDCKQVNPQKPRKKVRRSSQEITGRFKRDPGKYFSQTTTVARDINKDSSVASNRIKNEENLDKQLDLKLREIEERCASISETDVELEKQHYRNLCRSVLLQTIRDINADRKSLAMELLTQLRSRTSERYSAREALKLEDVRLQNKIRRLEMEKNEIQSSLEKELDRRSGEWSLRLGKFQTEEQRLRERVRELAEQNVSLQRELCSLIATKDEMHDTILNMELKLKDSTAQTGELQIEYRDLKHALCETQKRAASAEEERDFFNERYKSMGKEIKDLQKIVVRFRRTCEEQEKTITGLRHTCMEEVKKEMTEISDPENSLRLEQVRLVSVEQNLRREVEDCRREMESLQQENVTLLDHIRNAGIGCGVLIRLENELRDRVQYLQVRGLTLLHEHDVLCSKLLGLVKIQKQELESEFDGYSVLECHKKLHGLKTGVVNLERSLQNVALVQDEKSNLHASDCDVLKQWGHQICKDNVELELKAEALLTKVLQEKLWSKEVELEGIERELACSTRNQEFLKSESRCLKDELSSLKHNAEDMEIQMMRKDENYNHLKHEFENCSTELTTYKSSMEPVYELRDHWQQQAGTLREREAALKDEVHNLKKKIDSLEGEILLKEGQISILKDSQLNQGL